MIVLRNHNFILNFDDWWPAQEEKFFFLKLTLKSRKITLLIHKTICNLFMHQDVLTLVRVTTLLEVCLSCRRVHLGHILIRELSALKQSFSLRKVFILEQCPSQ